MKLYHHFLIGDRIRTEAAVIAGEEARQFALKYDRIAHLALGRTARNAVAEVSALLVQAVALRPLIADMAEQRAEIRGGLQILRCRFRRPVHVGDRLTTEAEIVAKRLTGSLGRVRQNAEVFNQRRESVARFDLLWQVAAAG